MEINRVLLEENKPFSLKEEIDFSYVDFSKLNLRGLSKCVCEATFTQYESLLRVKLHVKAEVIAICAYTLEDVLLPIEVNDEIDFTDDSEMEGEAIYEKSNIISLDDYVLSLILSKIPPRVVKKGAKRPGSGNGYRVLSEEELENEKKTDRTSPFDVLDNLDL